MRTQEILARVFILNNKFILSVRVKATREERALQGLNLWPVDNLYACRTIYLFGNAIWAK